MVDAYPAGEAHVLATLDLGDYYDTGGTWEGDPVAANLSANVPSVSKVFDLHVVPGYYDVGAEYVGDFSDAIDSDTLAAMSTDSTAGNETRGMHTVSVSGGTLAVPTRYLALVAVPTTFSATWYSDGGSLLVGSVDGDIVDPPDPPDEGEPTPDPPPDDPVAPGGAILEIYAGDPDGARWDIAEWDEADWSASAWVDITPQGIVARIRWGVMRPELGILAESDAATWAVDTYDPDRILDPSNAESPYVGDLIPGLPIRLRHDETVIRQGTVESLGYSFRSIGGYIRASDNLAVMANAAIPDDLEVADTLRARARDVIAAAGLAITVEPDPPAGDPAIPARIPAAATVWDVIEDAAQGVLHLPWIDNENRLRFRAYAEPLYRGRAITSAELVDLSTITDANGLFARVSVQPEDPEDDPIIRAVTPTPAYGAKTYTRDEPTLDPEGWASAVLADRSGPGRRWIPGEVYAVTADTVHMFATMEAVELVALLHSYTEPAVDIGAIVLGGEIRVVGEKDSAAVWTFQLFTAEAPPVALVDSETGAIFVTASDISDTPGALLYPSGEGALGGAGGSGGTGGTGGGEPGGDPGPAPEGVRRITPTDGLAAFHLAVADLSIDVVELVGTTFPWTGVRVDVDRTARPLTIRAATGYTASIVTTGSRGVDLSDSVHVDFGEGIRVPMPNHRDGFAIFAQNADHLTIRAETEGGVGGVWIESSTNVATIGANPHDADYAGIMYISVVHGEIADCLIERVGAERTDLSGGFENNAYGIAVTRYTGGSDPVSEDVEVHHNEVNDVPLWHGLDTHAGKNITFHHNTTRRTPRPLFITTDSVGTPPENVDAHDNLFLEGTQNVPGGTTNMTAITLVNLDGGTFTNNDADADYGSPLIYDYLGGSTYTDGGGNDLI